MSPAGTYVHPFPSDQWTDGRIDQGQDFAPKTNDAWISAPGNARVVKTGAPGWPGGGGVLLKLTDGARAGQYIFIYETLKPKVSAGASVFAGQPIATGQTGGTGVEIGFADSRGVPLAHGHYVEGHPTPEGREMASWLGTLPRPSGTALRKMGPVFNEPDITGTGLAGGGGAIPEALSAAISLLFKTLGEEGARILLYIGFVLGGTALALAGVNRMMGGEPARLARKAAVAATVAPK